MYTLDVMVLERFGADSVVHAAPGMHKPASLSSPMTSLSVLVPVYNEQFLVAESLSRLKVLETSPHLDRIEVIVVDDCSKDGTAAVLDRFHQELAPGGKIAWTFLKHEKNGGKGKAIQTALERATCEITVFHDADLEYHPEGPAAGGAHLRRRRS